MARKKKTSSGDIQGVDLRSSSAEFLAFTASTEESSVEVLFSNEMIWATQKMMAELFDCSVSNISQHLRQLYLDGELNRDATVKNFLTVQIEGKRQVEREREFYRLDAIIAVGYRVNSSRAIQFRQWATTISAEYTIKGYVLDSERMMEGAFLGEEVLDNPGR